MQLTLILLLLQYSSCLQQRTASYPLHLTRSVPSSSRV
jgi:hypothetical protein